MKKLKITNLKVVESTRKTSHMGSKCKLEAREAFLMKDYGFTQRIIYQAHGHDQMSRAMIYYNDGMVLPTGVVALVKEGNIIIVKHIGSVEEHSWEMKLEMSPESEIIESEEI